MNSFANFISKFTLTQVLLILTSSFLFSSSFAAKEKIPPLEPNDCILEIFAPISLAELADMSKTEVELALEKELSSKEQKVLRRLQREINWKRKLGIDVKTINCSKIYKRARGWGIAGIIFGGLLLGPIAIIMGLFARKKCGRYRRTKNGIILGIIAFVKAILVTIGIILYVNATGFG